MRMTFLIALIVFFAGNAFAGEKWECTDLFGSKVLVVAEVMGKNPPEGGFTAGKVIVAGTTQNAVFRVTGFNRRWDFGPQPDGSMDYAFIISPNGRATYTDFSNAKKGELVQPSMMYQCTLYKGKKK